MAKANIAKSHQKSKDSKGGDSGLFANLLEFSPLTENQAIARNEYEDGKNLLIMGYAGTGKTYIACSLALQDLANHFVHKIHIYRSSVPTREIGYLPGTEAQKMEVYEKPYIKMINDIMGRGDAYQILKTKDKLIFESTSFLRGISLDNTIVIVDETQNMTAHEINTLITRVGENTKIIFCGDFRQSDLDYRKSGISFLTKVLHKMSNHFSIIEMEAEDIVRSDLVRDWILAVESIKEDEN